MSHLLVQVPAECLLLCRRHVSLFIEIEQLYLDLYFGVVLKINSEHLYECYTDSEATTYFGFHLVLYELCRLTKPRFRFP